MGHSERGPGGEAPWLAERGGFCDCEVLLNVPPPDDEGAEEAAMNMLQRILDGGRE